jgi:hypothetical protein
MSGRRLILASIAAVSVSACQSTHQSHPSSTGPDALELNAPLREFPDFTRKDVYLVNNSAGRVNEVKVQCDAESKSGGCTDVHIEQTK